MGIEPPFVYDKPSSYTFSGATSQGFNPKPVSQSAWTPKAPRPKQSGPLISSREIDRHPDSYLIVPYGNLNWKPMSRHTKTIVKWVRILQLLLRICAFLGAAGLLVCVICIKPIGTTLDWIIRVPPGIALLHLTYALYHLSRSPKGRTPGSSASYMIFASIIDAGLIPFVVLTALLAHNQLQGGLGNGVEKWTTMFGSDMQSYIIIFSTFLISVTEASLFLTSLCISIYLAVTFRKISKLPPDMNPLEDNLTSRHKRNKSSLSTPPSNQDSAAPLISPSRSVPFAHTRNDSSNILSPQRRSAASNRGSRAELGSNYYNNPISQRSPTADLELISRPSSTIVSEQSRSPANGPPVRPRSTAASEHRYSPIRPNSTVYAELNKKSPRPPSTKPPSEYSYAPQDDGENWISHPSPPPSPPHFAPPELQHLRSFDAKQSYRASPPPAIKPAKYDKYDYSNRSPRPLAMNPPTPQSAEHRRSPGARALQNPNDNPSTRYWNPSVWSDIRLADRAPRSEVSASSAGGRPGKIYGDLPGGPMFGQARQGLDRVVSSGIDAGDTGAGSGMRAREVSGKVAEEGRARIDYVAL